MRSWWLAGQAMLVAVPLACCLVLPAQIPSSPPTTSAGENGKRSSQSPEDLLREAAAALGANHLTEARGLLECVRRLEATQPGLWSALGVLSLHENDASTAVVDFERELANHPDAVQVYAPLAATLAGLKRQPEALDALRAWGAAAPADPRPIALIVGMLLEDGRMTEAVKAGTDGLARLPEASRSDPQLQYILATAELKGENKVSGGSRMLTLLSLTNDISTRNSIAYALADAGVELPAAEGAERGVLNQLELESEGWSLEGDRQIPLLGTQLLTAAWDTMGWILFKEGKPAEAQPFVRAAWRNNPHADVGSHLSAIEAARGQPRTGGNSSNGAAELSHLRTFTLGPSAGRSGSATDRILVARGKVTRVHRDSGDLEGGAADGLLARLDLSALFPATGSYVQLVHRVTVNCSQKSCEMVLLP